MLLLSSCDLPAKALVSNMKAYNGKYGCATCKDMGAGSLNPLHRIWPFQEVVAIRTKQECYKSICEAVEKKEAVSFNCSYNIGETSVLWLTSVCAHHDFKMMQCMHDCLYRYKSQPQTCFLYHVQRSLWQTNFHTV